MKKERLIGKIRYFENTYWEAQTLYVGFSYNFGGKVRKRDIQNQVQQKPSGGGNRILKGKA